MKLDWKVLSDAFKVVDHVPSLNAIPSSLFVRLQSNKGKLSLAMKSIASAEVSVPAENQSWTFFVDRRLLGAFLSANANTKTPIEILSTPQKELVLRCGRRRLVLTEVEAIAGYEHWKRSGLEVQFNEAQQKALTVAAKFAPQTMAADHLSCVQLVKDYGMIATDSYVIFGCRDSSIKHTLPFPLLLPGLINGGKVLVSDAGSAVDFGNGYIHQPVSDRCVKEFPLKPMRAMLGKAASCPPLFAVPAKALLGILNRLSSFIFAASDDAVLHCHAPKDSLPLLFDLKTSQGVIHDKLKLDSSTSADVNMNWKYSALKTWLEYAESVAAKTIYVGVEEHVVVFRSKTKDGNGIYLVHAEIGD